MHIDENKLPETRQSIQLLIALLYHRCIPKKNRNTRYIEWHMITQPEKEIKSNIPINPQPRLCTHTHTPTKGRLWFTKQERRGTTEQTYNQLIEFDADSIFSREDMQWLSVMFKQHKHVVVIAAIFNPKNYYIQVVNRVLLNWCGVL